MAGIQLTQAGGAGVLNAGGAQNPAPFGTVITGAVCILAVVGTVPTTFTWGQAVPPLSTTAQLSTTTGASPTFTPDYPGLYDLTLTDQTGTVYTLQLLVVKTAVTVYTGPFSPASLVPSQIATPPVGQVLFSDSSNGGALSTKNSSGVVAALLQTSAVGADLAGTLPNPTVVGITGTAGIAAMHATTLQWDVALAPTFKIASAFMGTWVAAGLRIGDGAIATEKLEVVGNVKYDVGVAAPKLFQADQTAASTNGQALLVQAQNATGTGSPVGGPLDMRSGTGGTAGPITLRTGATTRIGVSAAGIITASGYGAGSMNTDLNGVLSSGPSFISLADLPTMLALPVTGMQDGTEAWVQSVNRSYKLVTTAATADPTQDTYTAASGRLWCGPFSPEQFDPRTMLWGILGWWRADLGVTLGGTLKSQGSSPPVVTITGTLTNAAALHIEITTGGTLGTALFKWSLDGGATYQQTGQITSASFALGTTGITAAFAAGTYNTNNIYDAVVATFADQNASIFNVAHGTTANQPLYVVGAQNGRACIRTRSANSEYLFLNNANLIGSGDYTILIAIKDSTGNGARYFSNQNSALSAGFWLGGSGTNRGINHSGVATRSDAAMQTTNPEIWGVRRLASALETLQVNGVDTTLSGGSTTLNDPGASAVLAFGAEFSGAAFQSFANLDIYEIIIVGRGLTDAERSRVTAYLRWRYAL